jgi:hypothetical protein
MEAVLWFVIAVGVAVLVWMAAPYHNRLIENRPVVDSKTWD